MKFREQRWPCRYPVVLDRRGERVRALLGNIAGEGALLVGVDESHPGERLVLHLLQRRLEAEVRWARGTRCGVRFATPLSPLDVRRIRQIVAPAGAVRTPSRAGAPREMR